MNDLEPSFAPLAERMRQAGMPKLAITMLKLYFQRLRAGADGKIRENEIEPLSLLPTAADLDKSCRQQGERALAETVLIKLNGGLGTSMGLDQAKSLIEAKNGLSFLDIIARQALAAGVPLILMNSFATRRAALERLTSYPELGGFNLPLDFVQHQIPRLYEDNLQPFSCPAQPEQEWCPPGHGDLYPALVTSGVLEKLRHRGYRYAFISNADNLGATLDPVILGYLVSRQAPFLMEVARRTKADRKGGHLARRRGSGGLLLREAAQCPENETAAFQDISRHRYFNTNSLWLDLAALEKELQRRDNRLELPLIINRKTLAEGSSASTSILQLETAMGAAIEIFPEALALEVPRRRFAPVKTTDDLLALRSDAYQLRKDFALGLAPELVSPPLIQLDSRYYRHINDFNQRFAAGVPSLRKCRSLRVTGNLFFARNISLEGNLQLTIQENQAATLPAGLTIADQDQEYQ